MLAERMFPLATFEEMRREMDRLFGGLVRGANGRSLRARNFPPVNVWETGETLIVEAEVPGFTMQDLEVEVVGTELCVRGTRKPLEGEDIAFHRQERGSGDFARFLTLPSEVNAEKIEAVLKDGVLTISLPKAETAKARKITVKTA